MLEISWTIAPAIVLLIIAVPTITVVFRTQAAPARGALEVIVRGRQWWWEFYDVRFEKGVMVANDMHEYDDKEVTDAEFVALRRGGH